MTTDEIVRMAKYIQFPYNNETYRNYYASVDAYKLPILPDNVLYSTMPEGNKHHYTTKYTYNFVLPAIANILGFDFNINDFDIVDCKRRDWDISYLVPKQEYEYELFCYTKDKHITGNYTDLFNPMFFKTYTYRNLFRYPHTCSRIINKTLDSSRTLMISGDSQMIPSVNPLTNYFKEVWYFDNRTGYIKNEETDEFEFHEDKFVSFSEMYNDIEFTDVLIQLYCRDLKWYEYWNLY